MGGANFVDPMYIDVMPENQMKPLEWCDNVSKR